MFGHDDEDRSGDSSEAAPVEEAPAAVELQEDIQPAEPPSDPMEEIAQHMDADLNEADIDQIANSAAPETAEPVEEAESTTIEIAESSAEVEAPVQIEADVVAQPTDEAPQDAEHMFGAEAVAEMGAAAATEVVQPHVPDIEEPAAEAPAFMEDSVQEEPAPEFTSPEPVETEETATPEPIEAEPIVAETDEQTIAPPLDASADQDAAEQEAAPAFMALAPEVTEDAVSEEPEEDTQTVVDFEAPEPSEVDESGATSEPVVVIEETSSAEIATSPMEVATEETAEIAESVSENDVVEPVVVPEDQGTPQIDKPVEQAPEVVELEPAGSFEETTTEFTQADAQPEPDIEEVAPTTEDAAAPESIEVVQTQVAKEEAVPVEQVADEPTVTPEAESEAIEDEWPTSAPFEQTTEETEAAVETVSESETEPQEGDQSTAGIAAATGAIIAGATAMAASKDDDRAEDHDASEGAPIEAPETPTVPDPTPEEPIAAEAEPDTSATVETVADESTSSETEVEESNEPEPSAEVAVAVETEMETVATVESAPEPETQPEPTPEVTPLVDTEVDTSAPIETAVEETPPVVEPETEAPSEPEPPADVVSGEETVQEHALSDPAPAQPTDAEQPVDAPAPTEASPSVEEVEQTPEAKEEQTPSEKLEVAPPSVDASVAGAAPLESQKLPEHSEIAVEEAPPEPQETTGVDFAAEFPVLAPVCDALAKNDLDDADRQLARIRRDLIAQGDENTSELAALTALAGDHAQAAGRIGGAKWLWRLALQRFQEADAGDGAWADAVRAKLDSVG